MTEKWDLGVTKIMPRGRPRLYANDEERRRATANRRRDRNSNQILRHQHLHAKRERDHTRRVNIQGCEDQLEAERLRIQAHRNSAQSRHTRMVLAHSNIQEYMPSVGIEQLIEEHTAELHPHNHPQHQQVSQLPLCRRPYEPQSYIRHIVPRMNLVCHRCDARFWHAEHDSHTGSVNPHHHICCRNGIVKPDNRTGVTKDLRNSGFEATEQSKEALRRTSIIRIFFANGRANEA